MDQESIVYGCIKDLAMAEDLRSRREANRTAMLSLPGAEEWSLLSRDMFALPTPQTGAGSYHTEVMHFGASYQAIEYEWQQWMAHFESLLKRMYWVSATVHLETEISGIHTFQWEASGNSHIPGRSDIQVSCEWSHESALQI